MNLPVCVSVMCPELSSYKVYICFEVSTQQVSDQTVNGTQTYSNLPKDFAELFRSRKNELQTIFVFHHDFIKASRIYTWPSNSSMTTNHPHRLYPPTVSLFLMS